MTRKPESRLNWLSRGVEEGGVRIVAKRKKECNFEKRYK